MATLYDLANDKESILALAPEYLAVLVLKEIIKLERPSYGRVKREDFSNSFAQRHEDVQRAIMEAWAWLEISGAIAQAPCHPDGNFFVTRRGHQLARESGTAAYANHQILPRHILHPVIDQKATSSFLRGDFDSAVFEAFKQVEVAVRDAGGFSASDFGVSLARAAFHRDSGPLSKGDLPAERQALSDPFAGALGSYKNPLSHRNVAIQDPTEAAEMLILASHLLKIVESRRTETTE